MGVVYEGYDPVLNRRVAVKTILRSAMADSGTLTDASARFAREAQAVARLNHPNIVSVFDFGEEGDVSYLVMEFVQGQELKEYFDQGRRFLLRETVGMVRELLAALDTAHRAGVIHRDVKPANVMIEAGGRVKLTDFGVARLADSSSERTLAGTIVGTPSHMSPEQIQGLPVGSRTDIFAAGIILYQCLTGQKPFPGPGLWEIQRQIIQEQPPPPSQIDPTLPAALDAIVACALAKSPADRYESATAFSTALELALAQREAAFAPAPQPTPKSHPDLGSPPQPASPTPAPDAASPPGEDMSQATVVLPGPARPAPPPLPKTPLPGARWLGGGLVVALLLLGGFLGRGYLFPPASMPGPAPAPPVEAVPATASPPALPQPQTPGAPPIPNTLPPRPPQGATTTAPPSPQGGDNAQPNQKKSASPPPVATHQARTPTPQKTRESGNNGGASPRCEALMQRAQLGEGASPELLTAIQKECQK